MTDAIASVRAFNRFYTGRLGMLDAGFLGTPHTLAEARVLFELAQQEEVEVAALRERMRIDPGQLSRLLARLGQGGLVTRARSAADARRQHARLTPDGRAAAALLDRRAVDETGARLSRLGDHERRRLVAALAEVRRLLDPAPAAPDVAVHPPRAGDLGWVVACHGQLYAEEYGWNAEFEALVARIVADFAAGHDAAREAAWIADVDGPPAGCVFCVRQDDDVAKLRLLLVEPRARGLGLGARLVEECVGFARRAGYRELKLWTNHPLVHARRIYELVGFRLEAEEPHRSFGHDLVGQTWTLTL